MNLIWRFLWTLLFSRFELPVNFMAESKTDYRVLPTDVDILLHMNNGRYFSFMDLGRINFMIRCGVFHSLKKHRIYPVIASEMIRFRKSIQLWKKFTLSSNILGWDDKFFYVAHHFIQNGEVHALGLIKARFLNKQSGSLNPADVLHAANITISSPALPDWVASWQSADKAFYDEVVRE